MSDPIAHIYIHIPFCTSICPFCSFDVSVGRPGAVEQYLDRLDTELMSLADAAVEPRTIYLGGGTPSLLTPREISRLVSALERRGWWAHAIERTIEVHPVHASASRLAEWIDLGFNRLSVGFETFDENWHRELGRAGSMAQLYRALAALGDVASPVVRCGDIIAHEDVDMAVADVSCLIEAGLEHLSVYALTVEQHTPFGRAARIVDPDRQAEVLLATERRAVTAGMRHYEVSNYAHPGYECQHNQAYWSGEAWLGIGPSATSRFLSESGARHVTNAPWTAWRKGLATAEVATTPAAELWREQLWTGLRCADGVDLGLLEARHGPIDHDLINQLVEREMLHRTGEVVSAFPDAWLGLDAVARMLA